MPCFRPLAAYQLYSGAIVFPSGAPVSGSARSLRLPCGRCVGCRLEKSRQWAVRIMHEASLWPSSVFATFTYSDENVPEDGSLDKRDMQLFFKRLRRRREPDIIRYYHSGEYGEHTGRPHYHAILFNVDFPDRRQWREELGNLSWRSDELESLWTLGHSEFGSVTFESAAYVAGYVMKKVTGPPAAEHYQRVHFRTGELVPIEPEYATMSRGAALGRGWMEQWADEVYPLDRVNVRGRDCKPPRAYDRMLAEADPVAAFELRLARQEALNLADQTEERLLVREKCADAKVNLFSRELS